MDKKIAVIILAAGKGKRMKSDIPKVLHPVCGRPMIGYIMDLVKGLKPSKTVVVLGHKYQMVRENLDSGVQTVIQKELNGTGGAVKQALPLLKSFHGTVLVLYADNPLLKKETIDKLLKYHRENNLDASLLTATVDNPEGYGRIIRDKYFNISSIVEEKDADEVQKDIKEINTGIVCFDKDKLSAAVKYLKPNNRKKEYYLTDIISIFYKKGYFIGNLALKDMAEAMGINSRKELAAANEVMQGRINEYFMNRGVTIVDPRSCFINYGTKIGIDTIIYPFTIIEKNVKIGKNCCIGPFAHLREGSCLNNKVSVGNFLEIVRSRLGSKTLAKHFGYIGDSKIGRSVNIGAGTVIANFNGRDKNMAIIEDNAFIGSDTVLISPVKIGRNAKTGAGSVVTKNMNVADNGIVAGVPARPLMRRQKKNG